jgi:hypothetical protein
MKGAYSKDGQYGSLMGNDWSLEAASKGGASYQATVSRSDGVKYEGRRIKRRGGSGLSCASRTESHTNPCTEPVLERSDEKLLSFNPIRLFCWRLRSQMAQQANNFPVDSVDAFFIPYQPNHAQQNAWVSFRHRTFCLYNCSFHQCVPQIPPAVNGQPEIHREDIPPPVRGARPGRMQDPHHFDVAYQGVVDYHPQPLLGVSNSHLTLPSLL